MIIIMMIIVIGALGTIPKGLVRGLGEFKIRGRDHPNYSIFEVRQNTERVLEI